MSEDTRPELHFSGDGNHYWNPRLGKEYFLGFHTISEKLIPSETFGTYLGTAEGIRSFFIRKGNMIFHFESGAEIPAVWYGSEDEPVMPAFRARYAGVVSSSSLAEHIRSRLNYHSAARRANKSPVTQHL